MVLYVQVQFGCRRIHDLRDVTSSVICVMALQLSRTVQLRHELAAPSQPPFPTRTRNMLESAPLMASGLHRAQHRLTLPAPRIASVPRAVPIAAADAGVGCTGRAAEPCAGDPAEQAASRRFVAQACRPSGPNRSASLLAASGGCCNWCRSCLTPRLAFGKAIGAVSGPAQLRTRCRPSSATPASSSSPSSARSSSAAGCGATTGHQPARVYVQGVLAAERHPGADACGDEVAAADRRVAAHGWRAHVCGRAGDRVRWHRHEGRVAADEQRARHRDAAHGAA